ncbi:MAG: hypothetical protein FWJ87_04295 [Micromonosporaceae bacterium]
MTAPAVTHAGPDSPDQELLVLTGGGRDGRRGLTLPFRDATVVGVDGRGHPKVTGTFDTVVLDCDDLDADRLADLAAAATAALRPGGHLFLPLCPGASAADRGGAPPAWLEGLRWQGVRVVDGLPFAVLATAGDGGDPPATTAARVAAAADTARALGALTSGRTEPDGSALARERELRRRSEQALLAYLESLVSALERERARHTVPEAVKSALRRRRAGRAVLRLARWLRRLARRSRVARLLRPATRRH